MNLIQRKITRVEVKGPNKRDDFLWGGQRILEFGTKIKTYKKPVFQRIILSSIRREGREGGGSEDSK